MGRPKGSKNKSTIEKAASKLLGARRKSSKTSPKETYSGDVESEWGASEELLEVLAKHISNSSYIPASEKVKLPFQSPIMECQVCKDLFWSSYEGEMKYCKCGKSFVDATKHYVRASTCAKMTMKYKDV